MSECPSIAEILEAYEKSQKITPEEQCAAVRRALLKAAQSGHRFYDCQIHYEAVIMLENVFNIRQNNQIGDICHVTISF